MIERGAELIAYSMNNLAKFYATTSIENKNDGAKAVYWAEKACDLTNYEDIMFIDTLAAAYAADGQ